MNFKRDLCESAKKGRVCIDDLCHGGDYTLCGFSKDEYDAMIAEELPEEYDDETPQEIE